MNDKWMNWAIQIQSLAQAGLAYCTSPYDRERYTALRAIAAEIAAERSGLPEGKISGLFCAESGYPTPKLDTRAAVFRDERILLVHEANGSWALPGGWCDVDQSVATNTVKEVLEETGLHVEPERLIAVQDWRRHNVQNFAFGVIKTFVLCRALGGVFAENPETTEIRFFGRDELPEQLAVEKTTAEQIGLCFDAAADALWQTQFD